MAIREYGWSVFILILFFFKVGLTFYREAFNLQTMNKQILLTSPVCLILDFSG